MINGHLVCATVAVGVTLASTLLASDGKRYPGSLCSYSTDDTATASRYPPKFQNDTGSARNVVCPIIQDCINCDLQYVDIVVHDTIDEDLCYLAERRDDGTWGTWLHNDVDSAGGGFNRIQWFDGDGNGNTEPNSVFAIQCRLPAGTAILSYKVEELT